ncbi:hypothetical protein ACFL6E_05570 [Candidatus Neomarinimicrobiota bacterium]
MAIEFNPEVVSVRLKQIESARKAKSAQSDSPDEKTTLSDMLLSASTTLYNLHGNVGLSTNKPGTLLDAYLATKKVIQDHMTLLMSNVLDPQLPSDQAAAAEGSTEYWNKENTAGRIFSIALVGYDEGIDQEQFADQATAMIEQAYRDVGSIFGIEFPEPVLDIRQTVLDAMEQLRGGAALSEISFE